jgi:hypothetical protein
VAVETHTILTGVVAVVRTDWFQMKPAISYPVDFGRWFRDVNATDNCVGLRVGTFVYLHSSIRLYGIVDDEEEEEQSDRYPSYLHTLPEVQSQYLVN